MTAGQEQTCPALAGLLDVLDLERLEVNIFRGVSPQNGWQRVYGGQVLGQALVAAGRTVEDNRPAHSLHAYFLLAGDPTHPILYEVERIRDGASFTTRRVKAIQHGRAIFAMSVSFHKDEEGYEHASAMPDVPPPEDLPSAKDRVSELIDALPAAMRNYWLRENPIELRPVDVSRYLSRDASHPPRQDIWLKANGQLADDPLLHQCVLAYASDFTLLDTALIAHGKLLFDPDIQLASLDHSLWFHRPFRVDDWLLYTQDSPNAAGARGFCRGSFYTRDGRLVASTAQEGLVRQRKTAFLIK
ncbi:acyl-CoA thioesterase II [Hyphomicrobium sp.]|uniref:acyl-CoA thioesterase II n=1 Tax=Hyphomicrobium sp. TaxID=82 RepID=UPI003F704B8F